MKIYYKVIHFFITKQAEHFHYFNIGMYDSKEKALDVVKKLQVKEGFSLRPKKFYVYRVLRMHKPKLLNKTFWGDGFTTIYYNK